MWVICDLDHTLSDSRWRDDRLPGQSDWQGWDHYHKECGLDKIVSETAMILRQLPDHVKIMILTGRPQSVAKVTQSWLDFYSIRVDILAMRSDDDTTPAEELKIRMAKEFFGNVASAVFFMIDDHPGVCAAFAKEGVTVFNPVLGVKS